MADLIVLQAKDLKGNCTLKGFEGQLELLSYSHGVAQQVTSDAGGSERVSGRPMHQDFAVTKYMDIASPNLNLFCCQGKNLKDVTITVGRNVEGKVEPLVIYTLSNAIISSVSVGGGGGDKPVESVTLNYSKIKWDYKPQATDVQVKGQLVTNWDVTLNTSA